VRLLPPLPRVGRSPTVGFHLRLEPAAGLGRLGDDALHERIWTARQPPRHLELRAPGGHSDVAPGVAQKAWRLAPNLAPTAVVSPANVRHLSRVTEGVHEGVVAGGDVVDSGRPRRCVLAGPWCVCWRRGGQSDVTSATAARALSSPTMALRPACRSAPGRNCCWRGKLIASRRIWRHATVPGWRRCSRLMTSGSMSAWLTAGPRRPPLSRPARRRSSCSRTSHQRPAGLTRHRVGDPRLTASWPRYGPGSTPPPERCSHPPSSPPRSSACTSPAGYTDQPQVHARYIAGLPKVNHCVYRKPSQGRATQTSGHQTLATHRDLQRSPRRCDASSLKPHKQGLLRSVAAAWARGRRHGCSMFARMSRYGPVAAGTTRHPLSWFAVQSGTS
jgi:hypothetical protein